MCVQEKMKNMKENHQRDLQELEVDKINLLFTDLILQQFGIYTDSQALKCMVCDGGIQSEKPH